MASPLQEKFTFVFRSHQQINLTNPLPNRHIGNLRRRQATPDNNHIGLPALLNLPLYIWARELANFGTMAAAAFLFFGDRLEGEDFGETWANGQDDSSSVEYFTRVRAFRRCGGDSEDLAVWGQVWMEVVVDIGDFAVLDDSRVVEAVAGDDRGAIICEEARGWGEVVFTVSFVDFHLAYCSTPLSATTSCHISYTIKGIYILEPGSERTASTFASSSSSDACSTPSPHTRRSPKDRAHAPSPAYTPAYHRDRRGRRGRT